MPDNPFFFVTPEIFAAICGAAIALIVLIPGLFIARNLKLLVIVLFCLGVGFGSGFMNYDKALNKYIDHWLLKERVYQILFKDFPNDRRRFVDEYASAYKTGGVAVVNDKIEEMKIIMLVNHLTHYSEKVPTDIAYKYITAKADEARALYSANGDICKRYMDYTGNFKEARKAMGDKIFLESIRYIPDMIVLAHDRSEYPAWLVNTNIGGESYRLNYDAWQKARSYYNITKEKEKDSRTSCLINTLNYEGLVKREPKEAVLIWKYWMKGLADKKNKR